MPRYRTKSRGVYVSVSDQTATTSVVYANDHLTGDLTCKELAEALRMLPLDRKSATCLLAIDRDVRDFLLGRLSQ